MRTYEAVSGFLSPIFTTSTKGMHMHDYREVIADIVSATGIQLNGFSLNDPKQFLLGIAVRNYSAKSRMNSI